MTDMQQPQEPSLNADEIQAAVTQRLAKYEKLNFLEHFAMFMGIAQILEISLKGLLTRKYGIDHESMERWTLGRTSHALRERGLRGDFCALLDSVVGYRNHIAHELMANEIMLRSLLGGDSARFEARQLEKGTYELEQLMFLYEWCDEHAAWD
jgi:hypothetical protein